MRICIFEDQLVENFSPLVHFRPVYELRCGATTLARKIIRMFPRLETVFHLRRTLAELAAEEYNDRKINVVPDDDLWLINGRILADEHLRQIVRKYSGSKKVFLKDDEVAVAFVPRSGVRAFSQQLSGEPFSREAFTGYAAAEYDGLLAQYPWDLVHCTTDAIQADFKSMRLTKKIAGKIYPGVHLLNRQNIVVGKGSVIKPGVVLDAEKGPIIIGANATVMPNAFIEGPAFIGDHCLIKVGAKIYHGSSIGHWCKVGGEVESSIIQSYSNKQHDGFLGHSYLGSWVNIGADTNTSDLKNTYGTVNVHVRGRLVDTKMQFVGLTMGDHSKTGINVMFDTGAVVGVSCNIYGAGLPPKFVPSFSWGEKGAFSPYALEKSLETARRVMARRNVPMSEAFEKLMRGLFAATESERQSAGIF